jgi:hypothetical protein
MDGQRRSGATGRGKTLLTKLALAPAPSLVTIPHSPRRLSPASRPPAHDIGTEQEAPHAKCIVRNRSKVRTFCICLVLSRERWPDEGDLILYEILLPKFSELPAHQRVVCWRARFTDSHSSLGLVLSEHVPAYPSKTVLYLYGEDPFDTGLLRSERGTNGEHPYRRGVRSHPAPRIS